jgi:hypothetical protein
MMKVIRAMIACCFFCLSCQSEDRPKESVPDDQAAAFAESIYFRPSKHEGFRLFSGGDFEKLRQEYEKHERWGLLG